MVCMRVQAGGEAGAQFELLSLEQQAELLDEQGAEPLGEPSRLKPAGQQPQHVSMEASLSPWRTAAQQHAAPDAGAASEDDQEEGEPDDLHEASFQHGVQVDVTPSHSPPQKQQPPPPPEQAAEQEDTNHASTSSQGM